MLLGAFAMMTLSSETPAYADVIQCGDVLGPGGRFTLEQNLECGDNAITLDGATLDLKGHIVTCSGGRCVTLTGSRAKLLNGVVTAGFHESITLIGTGRHLVKNVTSSLMDTNIVVRSDHNELDNVWADSFVSPAIVIQGHFNRLTNSAFHCMVHNECILVLGNGNRLIGNIGIVSSDGVFSVRGNGNLLQDNRAMISPDSIACASQSFGATFGIAVSGVGNRIIRNIALDTCRTSNVINPDSVDLSDTNGDCDQNTWRQNMFRSKDPECIQ
jgi:hypothetical protein